MKPIRTRLTYANVMSTIAVFLVIGGASALAAVQLGKGSVGTRQLKRNAVTAAKIKKNAVSAAKIHKNAVTTAKIKNGAVNGAKVNEASLGTVPNSAATDAVKTARGTLAQGQQATILERGPLKLIVRCEAFEIGKVASLIAHAYIESSTDGTVFDSWEDGSKSIGPESSEEEREATGALWAYSNGPFAYEGASPVSATAASGESFTAFVAYASEKDTNTCWYWMNATIIS